MGAGRDEGVDPQHRRGDAQSVMNEQCVVRNAIMPALPDEEDERESRIS